jgi:hypothetical protein
MKKIKKESYYTWEFVLIGTILNCTIPGIVPSEFILSGDPRVLRTLGDPLYVSTTTYFDNLETQRIH